MPVCTGAEKGIVDDISHMLTAVYEGLKILGVNKKEDSACLLYFILKT